MQGTKTTVIECARINSLGAEQNEDYENKSAWINKISPTLFKKGDDLTLQNVMVNIPGADTNAIYFQGGETRPGSNIQDNFALLKLGYYINHNGIYTASMPLKYTTRSGAGSGQAQYTTILTDQDKTLTSLINNRYGCVYDFQYFYEDGIPDGVDNNGNSILVADQRISRIDKIESCNPNSVMDGKKYAKINPKYVGWMRSNDADASDGLGVEPLLLTDDVPILLNRGFTNPQAIADSITLTMNSTNKLYTEDVFLPEANIYKSDSGESNLRRVKEYNLNGYSYKTVTCNLQASVPDEQHHIYSNIAVDEPFLWKHGMNIISNAAVDNLQGNPYIKNTLTNYENLRVDYPVIIWNRFIGDDPSDFDIGDDNQYVLYSPWIEEVGGAGSSTVLTVSELSKKRESFNDTYLNIITDDGNGAYVVYDDQDTFKIVRNANCGTGIDKPGLFVDNAHPSETDIIAWSRFMGLSGTWQATQHQIFKTADNFEQYVYEGDQAELFFSYEDYNYTDITCNVPATGMNDTSRYVGGILTDDSGGIVAGGQYSITFTTTYTSGPGSSSAYQSAILVRGNGVGLDEVQFTADGDHTIPTFTATATNTGPNAIQFGIAGSDKAADYYIDITNISILRVNIGDNDPYTVSNTWTSNYTTTSDNKIYSIQRLDTEETVEVIVTNNSIPTQIGFEDVDYNQTYKSVATGLVVKYSNGSLIASNQLNGHDENVGLFLYQDENNGASYWMYQKTDNSENWYMARTTYWATGTPINGTILGTLSCNESKLKNAFRNGQQYYDLEGANNWTYETTFVDFTKAPLWNISANIDGDEYVPYNAIGQLLTETLDNGTVYPYEWRFENQTKPDIIYYLQLNEDGISGNYQDDTGNNRGTWSYANDTITFDATAGYGLFLYTAAFDPAPVITGQIQITQQDFMNPPGLPWNTGRYYRYSFERYISTDTGFKTYYITLVDGGEDDDSYNGLKGVVYTAAGATNEGTWGLDPIGKNWYSGIANDDFTLTAEGGMALTNIIAYETSQNILVGNKMFSVPTNGKMYGENYSDYGSTEDGETTEPVDYLGANSSTDFENLQDMNGGFVYDKSTDAFATNNGKKWALVQDALNEQFKIQITRTSDSALLLELVADYTNIKPKGWILFRTAKLLNAELRTNDTSIHGIDQYARIVGESESIDNNLVGPITTGATGVYWQLYSSFSSEAAALVDRGLFKTQENVTTENYKADLEEGQLLMTNIKFTQANVEMIENFFRYNEVYSGSKTTRTEIKKDVNNYYVEFDLGRGSDIPDVTHGNDTDNTTGQTPLQSYFMYDSGVMGSNSNLGSMSPMNKLDGNEQRIRVYTRWLDGYEARYKADGMLDYQYCYGDTIITDEFSSEHSDLYNYVKTNNIGVIPFKAKDGTLRIAFETFQDYQGELYKIQNLTYFIYSPQFVDHNYVTIFNNDAPAKKDNDYNYTGDFSDFCSFINVGASKPALDYNAEFNKFSWKYWHTPVFFNKVTGSDADLGQEISRFFDNANNIIFRDYPVGYSKGAFDDRIHIGINDSQAGIFLIDSYFKNVDKSIITSSTDSRAMKMTPDNFYNSIWFRLGFTYYNMKPIKFQKMSFYENRFSNVSYNNIISNQSEGLSPFTTNALVNMNDMPGMNVYSQNSGTSGTENPNKGTPIFGLGYNNNLTVAVQTESDVMYSQSLPVNITSGFFRIYTDLPCDTLDYTASTNLNCIGIGLLNYASSGQFFFSYAMDYGVTITRDVMINNIRIEIRDERGSIIQGLGDRSTVMLKLSRSITIGPPAEDPEIEELKKIEDELKDEDKDEEKDPEERSGGSLKMKGNINDGNMDKLYDNLRIALISEAIEGTHVNAGDTEADVARSIMRSVERARDPATLRRMRRLIQNRDFSGLDGFVRENFNDDININSRGQMIQGRRSNVNDIGISKRAAEDVLHERDLSKNFFQKMIDRKQIKVDTPSKPKSTTYTPEQREFIDKNIVGGKKLYKKLFKINKSQAQRLGRSGKLGEYINKFKTSWRNGNIAEFRRYFGKYVNQISNLLGTLEVQPEYHRFTDILGYTPHLREGAERPVETRQQLLQRKAREKEEREKADADKQKNQGGAAPAKSHTGETKDDVPELESKTK